MIVKNESKIISRLLTSVLPLIDSYCICDTGSTDDTVEIIEAFFKEKDVPGKVVHKAFIDFGFNRSYALKQCNDMENADYILLLDADMILKINPTVDIKTLKDGLTKDAYYVYQGTDSFYYKNIRVLKNDPLFSYWGVTHEFIKIKDDASIDVFQKDVFFIDDIGDGGCKTDKFERDIELLKKGLEDLPNNERYTFYLANSYRDAKQYENAIETFKKRVQLGGWKEEVWHSVYSIGNCYKHLNDMPNAVFYWLEAYNYSPNRIENLYEVISYYRQNCNYNLAYQFYEMADYQIKMNTTRDFLFLQNDIYEYKLDYELTIMGYYINRHEYDLHQKCMKVLMHPLVTDPISSNVLSNYKFYTGQLKDMAIHIENLALLQNCGKSIKIDNSVFVQSTPSICIDDNELIVNTRYVNYRINESGNYINQQNVITKNVVSVIDIEKEKWTLNNEFELGYDKIYDGMYIGLEDIRLLSKNGKIHFSANRGVDDGVSVESGFVNLKSRQTVSNIVTIENQRKIEKNWVLFPTEKGEIKMIYEWYPLTVGNHISHSKKLIDKRNKPLTELEITHKLSTPSLFKRVRGSTNGLLIKDEIWFICHVVSYETRRYYYHILVTLDAKTFELKRYSRLFTFEKNPVEYTLGFVYFEKSDNFLIGYSVMDKETKYIMVSKSNMETLFYNG